MNVGSLTASDFAARMRDGGVRWCVGPFVAHVRSRLDFLAHALHLLYSDYELADDDAIADFHINLDRPKSLRRWIRPQSVFSFDGHLPFLPFPLRLALPLYEWGFNYCVASRSHQYLVIHAGVLEKDGRAVVMPGPPGAGKSTLTAALCHRGWRLLSDELALIRTSDGMVVPVPRPVALKDASIDIIRRFVPGVVIGPASPDTVKGTVAHMRPPTESIRRAGECARLAWVVFPSFGPSAAPLLKPLPRAQGFLRLAQNAFNYSVLGPVGFETLAKVMESAACYECSYSSLDEALTMFQLLRTDAADGEPGAAPLSTGGTA